MFLVSFVAFVNIQAPSHPGALSSDEHSSPSQRLNRDQGDWQNRTPKQHGGCSGRRSRNGADPRGLMMRGRGENFLGWKRAKSKIEVWSVNDFGLMEHPIRVLGVLVFMYTRNFRKKHEVRTLSSILKHENRGTIETNTVNLKPFEGPLYGGAVSGFLSRGSKTTEIYPKMFW